MKKMFYMVPLLAALLMAGCDGEENFVAPSFVHVDGIRLVPSTTGALTTDPGFYTSDIVGAYVVAYYSDEKRLDTLGLFRLPFTVPVLYDGAVDYLEFYPAVEQSGIARALPYYTFYHPIRINDTVLRSGDTLDFDTLRTTYNLRQEDVLMREMFEPTEGSLIFDSVMGWRPQSPEEACTGRGYGYVAVSDTEYTKQFDIDIDFVVPDPQKLLYLELDTRSDVEFRVFMISSYRAGGAPERESVMAIRPSSEWKHIYVNLGRTWAQFGHNPEFRLSFSAMNTDGVGGEVRLDNLRVLTTSVAL